MEITLYHLVCLAIILNFSIILSIQDIKSMSVSLYIQLGSIFAALICQLIFARNEIRIYIISSLILGALYYAVRKITKNKLGLADVWFGLFQGLFLTPKMISLCLAAEVILAFCLVSILNKKMGKKPFPFIPYMTFGLLVAFVVQVGLNR
ncbi:MAG: hypothetical protein K6F69_01425 [Treponema sp.]|nr:hypothetical protein [Treponema sp.]